MARIKDSSVEAVKAAAEILPLVEDYVRLRKAGGTYKGLCPFHDEKTPSFTVSPVRGTYKCFGCGEGGDAIAFVEKLEQVDFVGAIEALAQRFGVEIEYEEISPEADRARKRKQQLTQLMERATSFYEKMLWESEQGAFARDYLASRGFHEEVCRQFRLGYAPGGPTLTRRALQEGFTQQDLLAGGLVNRRGNDYFTRRLVFPLADARGAVRGFQARKLHDDDPALRMPFDDPLHGAEHPLAVGLARLALVGDLQSLVRGEPFPRAPVLLAQVGIDVDRESEPLAEDLRRLARAAEVARVERVDLLGGEPVGEGLRLPPAVLVQRPVGVTLQLPLGVPIGLAVADEQERGHVQLG
jgi:hypothetical protein